VWNQDTTIADFLCVKISDRQNLSVYSDIGYDLKTERLVRRECGVLKCFDSKWIKGLFGIGYKYEERSIAGYLFVHI
jgi:hypothetical protein